MNLAIVSLALTLPVFGQTISTTGTTPARPGSTATISVALTGANGAAAVQFFLNQPAGVAYSVAPGPALPAGKTLTCGASPGALYGCVIMGGTSPLTDGVIASITFTVPQTLGTIRFAISDQIGADAAGMFVQVTATPPFSLTVMSACDLNGDGVVDQADVSLMVTQVIARAVTAMFDLSGDGMVNVVDAQRVVIAVGGGQCRVGR